MKFAGFYFILSFLSLLDISAQEIINLSGYVTDERSGEKIIDALVCIPARRQTIITNEYGFFSIPVQKGKDQLLISCLGYKRLILDLHCTRDTSLLISISPNLEIKEIIIRAEDPNRVNALQCPGLKNLPMKMVQQLPVILGEKDILKSLQILPGVNPGSEANTGIFVRGGESGHNLVLLDGVELFNPDHLFGFFSVFNDDAIKNIRLYSSSFPSRYSGRLASVLDIRTRDGNSNKIRGKLSAGLISSKLQFEGPIVKNKLMFILSARRTYLDIFPPKMVRHFTDFSEASYSFQDLNGRLCWRINNDNNLYFSVYNGLDKGYFSTSSREGKNPPDSVSPVFFSAYQTQKVEFGNSLQSLRYEKKLSGNLFMNLCLGFTKYEYEGITRKSNRTLYLIEDTVNENRMDGELQSGSHIRQFSFSADFNHYLNSAHQLTYGGGSKILRLLPILKNTQENTLLNKEFRNQQIYFFAQDKILAGKRFKLNPGLHFNIFQTGTETQMLLEKRLSVIFSAGTHTDISISYDDMSQYLHLLKMARINLASDLWLPSGGKILPSKSRNFSLDVSHYWKDIVQFNLAVYYRDFKNLLAYKEGAFIQENLRNFEEIVTRGKGKAYGFEISLEKNTGTTTGILSYCYSLSSRHFPELNNGSTFGAQYDRPHVLKMAIIQPFRERWILSGTFHLMSGSLQTVGNGVVSHSWLSLGHNPWSQNSYEGYEEIIVYRTNSYRLPLYHRMDVSATYKFPGKGFSQSLSLGIYNIYNARNVYEVQSDIFFRPDGRTQYVKQTEKTLFPIIPFLSYNLEF